MLNKTFLEFACGLTETCDWPAKHQAWHPLSISIALQPCTRICSIFWLYTSIFKALSKAFSFSSRKSVRTARFSSFVYLVGHFMAEFPGQSDQLEPGRQSRTINGAEDVDSLVAGISSVDLNNQSVDEMIPGTDTPSENAFNDPLSDPTRIRLPTVQPGDGPILCLVQEASKDDVKYFALSHTWGNPVNAQSTGDHIQAAVKDGRIAHTEPVTLMDQGVLPLSIYCNDR